MPSRKIIPFCLPREEALARIRSFMMTDQFEFDPHCLEAMRDREITMRQVITVGEGGSIAKGPELDEYGAWRCKLKKRVAGKLVRVVVAIERENLLFVTTF